MGKPVRVFFVVKLTQHDCWYVRRRRSTLLMVQLFDSAYVSQTNSEQIKKSGVFQSFFYSVNFNPVCTSCAAKHAHHQQQLHTSISVSHTAAVQPEVCLLFPVSPARLRATSV